MKTIYKGNFSKIQISKYYDLDGMIIEEGSEELKLEPNSEVEIKEKKSKLYGINFTTWLLFVNGEKVETNVDITGYKALTDRLAIRGCTGAG